MDSARFPNGVPQLSLQGLTPATPRRASLFLSARASAWPPAARIFQESGRGWRKHAPPVNPGTPRKPGPGPLLKAKELVADSFGAEVLRQAEREGLNLFAEAPHPSFEETTAYLHPPHGASTGLVHDSGFAQRIDACLPFDYFERPVWRRPPVRTHVEEQRSLEAIERDFRVSHMSNFLQGKSSRESPSLGADEVEASAPPSTHSPSMRMHSTYSTRSQGAGPGPASPRMAMASTFSGAPRTGSALGMAATFSGTATRGMAGSTRVPTMALAASPRSPSLPGGSPVMFTRSGTPAGQPQAWHLPQTPRRMERFVSRPQSGMEVAPTWTGPDFSLSRGASKVVGGSCAADEDEGDDDFLMPRIEERAVSRAERMQQLYTPSGPTLMDNLPDRLYLSN